MMKIGKTIKKVAAVAATVVIVAMILLFVTTLFLNRKKNVPTFIFGYATLRVETGSMEPFLPEKGYIFVKKSDGKNLEVGTVITFVCRDSSSTAYGKTVTHRITEVTEEGYRTKGDASNPDTWVVSSGDVEAVFVAKLPFLTVVGRIFASPIGLILIIGVFTASCAFIYIPDITEALKDESDKTKDEEIERRVREEVRKMQERDKDGNAE